MARKAKKNRQTGDTPRKSPPTTLAVEVKTQQDVHRYFNVLKEKVGDIQEEEATSPHTDGRTLYRALARTLANDPSHSENVRSQVTKAAIYCRMNVMHPLYAAYLEWEQGFRECALPECSDLFEALLSPDYYLARPLLEAIACLLNVHLEIYESIAMGFRGAATGCLVDTFGILAARTIAVLPHFDESSKIRYCSLLPDQSGKALVEYLQATRRSSLEEYEAAPEESRDEHIRVQELGRCKATIDPSRSDATQLTIDSDGDEVYSRREFEIQSYNELRQDEPKDNLTPIPLSRMDIYTITIRHPRQVEPALAVFWEALARAPNQGLHVHQTTDRASAAMRPHCGVDCEFRKYPVERCAGKSDNELRAMVDRGELEELCSVMTIGIGDKFFLNVNIAYMLENPDEDTVPALSHLMRSVIFNDRLLKIWWNLQHDISVLDSTIAHCFQGTARSSFRSRPYRGMGTLIEPEFRLSSKHFNQERPSSLCFLTDETVCEMHRPRKNEHGLTCQCRLGHVDLGPLLNKLSGSARRLWIETRFRYNYAALLWNMLSSDKRYSILQHLKDAAGRGPRKSHLNNLNEFYQGLGQPNMELNTDQMDDKNFVGAMLAGWQSSGILSDKLVAPRFSRFGIVGHVQLIDDNISRFREIPFAELKTHPSITSHMNPWDRELTVEGKQAWEHDDVVRIQRSVIADYDSSKHSQGQRLPWVREMLPKDTLRQRLFEPTEFRAPDICTTRYDILYEGPIVRAGTTHNEALTGFLQSSRAKGGLLPKGWRTLLANSDPQLRALGCVLAGSSGTERSSLSVGSSGHSRQLSATDSTDSVLSTAPSSTTEPNPPAENKVKPLSLVEEAMEVIGDFQKPKANMWTEKVSLAKNLLQAKVMEERRLNEMVALPTRWDPLELIDEHGREYRRRVEAAEEWNQPRLPTLEFEEDGTWKSHNVILLRALEALGDESEWTEVRR